MLYPDPVKKKFKKRLSKIESTSKWNKRFYQILYIFLQMYILEIKENPKYFEQPYNYHYHNNNVEDVFYLMVHWDIIIDKPEKKTCNNQYD